MDRRQALRLLGALGATGLVAACGADRPEEEEPEQVRDSPIRIGLLVPQSGAVKAVGTELVNGFQLYLDLNEGRLGGHPVELAVVDEGEDAKSAAAAIDELLGQGVTAIAGAGQSGLLLPIRDKVEEARIPLLAANGVPRALQGVIYMWCTSHVEDEPGKALGPHLARKIEGTVAIVAARDAAGTDAVNGFRESFGVTDERIANPVVFTEPQRQPGADAYADALRQVAALAPAAIFCHYTGVEAIAFVRQLRGVDLTAPLYSSSRLTEGDILTELGAEAVGIFTASNYSADLSNAANRRFASAFRKAHGVGPTATAMAAYDAGQVLHKAIRIAGESPSPQDLNLAIGKVGQIDSPRGVWQFNQPRTPQQRWYLREVRRDGQVLSDVTISELSTLG